VRSNEAHASWRARFCTDFQFCRGAIQTSRMDGGQQEPSAAALREIGLFPREYGPLERFFRPLPRQIGKHADYRMVASSAFFGARIRWLFTKISPSRLCTDEPLDLSKSRGVCLWIEMGIAIIRRTVLGRFQVAVRPAPIDRGRRSREGFPDSLSVEFALENRISSFPQGFTWNLPPQPNG